MTSHSIPAVILTAGLVVALPAFTAKITSFDPLNSS
jgi:hypothetical protein